MRGGELASGPPEGGIRSPAGGSLSGLLLRIGVWGLVDCCSWWPRRSSLPAAPVTLQWAAQRRCSSPRQAADRGDLRFGPDGDFGRLGAVARWRHRSDRTAPRSALRPFLLLETAWCGSSGSARQRRPGVPARPSGRWRAAMRLPPAMAAMLPIAIERVDIDRLSVRRAQAELLDARNVEAVFRHDGESSQTRACSTPTWRSARSGSACRGEASVWSARPTRPTAASPLSVTGCGARTDAPPLRVDVRLNGPLEELACAPARSSGGLQSRRAPAVSPLDPRPLRQVRLALKDLDLSAMRRRCRRPG